MLRYTEPGEPSRLTTVSSEGIQLHEAAKDMPSLPVGRFCWGPNRDRLYAMACRFPSKGEPGRVLASTDCGESWAPLAPFGDEDAIGATDSGAFLCTPSGTLVAAFSNRAEMVKESEWDPETKDALDWRLPTWAVRSVDGGKTWCDARRLHEEWSGANRDMIRLRDGRLVFSSMKLLHRPGRHSVLTYASDDEGATWKASNLIDLGGCGHHGGITEATPIELADGRLMKLIRTNWGQLWRAFSFDRGDSWHPYGPAGIDASSAPPALCRLQSGRIALAWNRYFPEGQEEYPLTGGDGIWSATPVSNFREELSVSFSEDECESWTPPVVVARNPGGEVSYPYVFEVEAGVLWITAHRYGLRMQLRETDVL